MMTNPRTWLTSRAARLIGLAALVLAAAATSVSADTLMMPKRDARMGVSVVVWGVTTQANGSAFTLDYGDGSTPTSGNVADRSYIAFNHTYATQGTFTATLTVGAESATVQVQVFNQALLPGGVTGNNNRSLGINMAIEDGLRYLWTSKRRAPPTFRLASHVMEQRRRFPGFPDLAGGTGVREPRLQADQRQRGPDRPVSESTSCAAA